MGRASDLRRRLLEHRRGKSSFSARDTLKDPVYYEVLPSVHEGRGRREGVEELAAAGTIGIAASL